MPKYLNIIKIFKNRGFTPHLFSQMKKGEGFTLVEMMTTALIFSLVAGMAIGLLISVIRVQRYNLVSQQLLDQVSYTIEYMSRAIRMAQKESSAPNCLSSNDLNYEIKDIPETSPIVQGLMFRDYNNKCKGFFLEGGQIKEYEKGRTPEILELTSNKLEISALKFAPVGGSSSDDIQPKVTIFIEVKEKNSTSAQKIKVQTTISQRNVDLGAGAGATTCSGTDTSCGIWPACDDCTLQNGCAVVGAIYEYYSCLGGTICALSSFDDCSDCSCSCGDYNQTESTASDNCLDLKDNDCDGDTDSLDLDC